MGRKVGSFGSFKTVGADQTVTFTQNEIPSRGLVALHIGAFKSGAGLSDIGLAPGAMKRIKLKAGNRPIIDIPAERLIAYMERFSLANKSYGESAVEHATNDFSYHFTLPLHFLDTADEDIADLCQFPANSPATLEIETGGNMETGTTIGVAWTVTDTAPAFFPLLLNQKLNFGASATRQRSIVHQDGVLRGIGIPYSELGRLEIWQDGELQFDAQGLASSGSFECNLIAETQGVHAPYPTDVIANGDHLFVGIDNGIPVRRGEGTVLYADTGASWATTGPDDEITVYSVVPLNAAA